MNPTTNHGPELQLPAPVAHNQVPQSLPEMNAVQSEQYTAVPEQTRAPQQAAPALQPISAATAPQNASTGAVPTTTNVAVPAVADDQDLIEKEWVAKAKQIVDKTRDDPYQQSQELTVFKNDYMQKRYNKTIKLGE